MRGPRLYVSVYIYKMEKLFRYFFFPERQRLHQPLGRVFQSLCGLLCGRLETAAVRIPWPAFREWDRKGLFQGFSSSPGCLIVSLSPLTAFSMSSGALISGTIAFIMLSRSGLKLGDWNVPFH